MTECQVADIILAVDEPSDARGLWQGRTADDHPYDAYPGVRTETLADLFLPKETRLANSKTKPGKQTAPSKADGKRGSNADPR
jgi:hypothetical protein